MSDTTVFIEMPLFTDLNYRYSLPLEGVSLYFTFHWNERASQWHMDISLEDLTPILKGMALVPQYPMAVDYSLEEQGLTGYFALMPVSVAQSAQLGDSSGIMPQFFKLFYVHITET